MRSTSGERAIVYGFDAADGRLLWKKGVRGGITAPTIRGNTVYLGFGNFASGVGGGVVALYLRVGAFRWRWSAPDLWMSSPPSTDGTFVYMSLGYGRFVALDERSGALVWEQDFDGSTAGRNAPIGGRRLFVGTGIGTVRALDAASGAVLWERQLVRTSVDITFGRVVYVVASDADDGGKDRVVALDPASGAVLWTHIEDGNVAVRPVASDGEVLYVPVATREGGRLVTLDESSGEPLGSIDLEQEDFGGPLSPAVAYDHVYLSVEDRVVSLAPAN